uniref:Uncharacterized protein n=1 Tax=Pararge aegeria TaxID=116150 RepID=S4P2G3_9NEOP
MTATLPRALACLHSTPVPSATTIYEFGELDRACVRSWRCECNYHLKYLDDFCAVDTRGLRPNPYSSTDRNYPRRSDDANHSLVYPEGVNIFMCT